MIVAPRSEITDDLLAGLLAQPTPAAIVAFLDPAGILNDQGLQELLEVAAQRVRKDPGEGLALASICSTLAGILEAPQAAPRAAYIAAQAYAANAELETALAMIEQARSGFLAQGLTQDALRTQIGRMTVLIDLGRYDEALETGRVVLEELNAKSGTAELSTDEATFRSAVVYQNHGACYEQMGRYAEALDAYAAAEQRYRALHLEEHAGEIINNRGVILLLLGRCSEALAAFEQAATVFREADLLLPLAQTYINIGDAYLLLGNFAQALEQLQQARQLFTTLQANAEGSTLVLDTADAYLALNLYPEAIANYREAEIQLGSAGIVHTHARTLAGLGAALLAQGRLADAEHALVRAAEHFERAGNLPMLTNVMLEQSALLLARGSYAAALTSAQQAYDLSTNNDWPVQQIYALLRLADLLSDQQAIEQHLMIAQRQADQLLIPQLRFRLRQRLGHLRRLQQRTTEAEVLLEAAVSEIEYLRGTLAHEITRTSFLRDKTAAYDDLVLLYLDTSRTIQAFSIAERARSRALSDMLSGLVTNEQAHSSPLNTRRSELQGDLNSIYNELLGGTDSRNHQGSRADLYTRAASLEQALARMRVEASIHEPGADATTPPVALADLQAALPIGHVAVAYYTIDDEILAFVISHSAIQSARRIGSVALVRQLLERLSIQWERMRANTLFTEQHQIALERSARRILHGLYEAILAPIAALLPYETAEQVGQLVIVPHGPLHQVPFHALFDGQQYLIERYVISYAPSATIFQHCQQRPIPQTSPAYVFGVPDPLVPAVEREVLAVAAQLQQAHVMLGEQATIAALQQIDPSGGMLHLACHGLFRTDNPIYSALKLHDGWIHATDVLKLTLANTLVVLSACESGRAEVIGGDEMIGLARAVLGAGATTLIVSMWLVQDEATADLMAAWYQQKQRGSESAVALRTAQLMIKTRLPHPYYWAPFMLIGQR